MSRVARQLCDEIEAPLRGKDSHRYGNYAGKNDNKPKRSIIIDKQKVISNIIPKNASHRSTSRITFKSDDTILNKSFTDIGINTVHKGPLVSDGHSVTLVQRRTNEKCKCKNPQKCYPSRRKTKEVQTCNLKLYSFSDKACLHCVDTITCGTQFSNLTVKPKNHFSISQNDSKQVDISQMGYLRQLECLSHIRLKRNDNLKQPNTKQLVLKQLELRKLGLKQPALGQRDNTQPEEVRKPSRVPNINFLGARRWSLSQYATNGPDF